MTGTCSTPSGTAGTPAPTGPAAAPRIGGDGRRGHIGLAGAFVIAEAADTSATVFLENAADGQSLEDTDRLAQVIASFGALRGEALTVGASRELILKVAEERWTD